MGLRAVVVGIPGVGKTTVVEKLVIAYHGARLVNYGSVMFEEGKSLNWIRHRDDLRRLPVEKQRELQKIAATKIAKMREPLVVVDTHLFIRTPEGLWPGLPFEVVRAIKPTHLVLIEATPEEILKRRMTDSTRYRDILTKERLAEELSLARSFLAAISTLTGAPISMVSNSDGMQDKVAGSLVKMLRKAGQ